jgi:hypothetical protein
MRDLKYEIKNAFKLDYMSFLKTADRRMSIMLLLNYEFVFSFVCISNHKYKFVMRNDDWT